MLHLTLVTAPTDAIRALIGELDAELSAHYPPDQRHGLQLDAIFQPHIRFYLASLGGVPVGCAGVALFADYAEVKRMYVRPAARGHGVAQALLSHLAATAQQAGLALLALETGTEQHAAMRLYTQAGFTHCPAFGAYTTMPPQALATSVFMQKRLG